MPKEKNCLPIIIDPVKVTFRKSIENMKTDLGRQKNNFFNVKQCTKKRENDM